MIWTKLFMNRTTIILVVVVVFLAMLGIQTIRANKFKQDLRVAENERDQAVAFANDSEQKLELYVNSYNQQVAKTKVTELTLENVQRLRESDRLKFLKQFDALKKDLRNLESASSVELNLNKDSVRVQLVNVPCEDSVKMFRYYYHDEFNMIDAIVMENPVIEIRVPVNSVVYWERKKKFLWWRVGAKSWSMEVTSPNPLIQITKADLIRVERK